MEGERVRPNQKGTDAKAEGNGRVEGKKGSREAEQKAGDSKEAEGRSRRATESRDRERWRSQGDKMLKGMASGRLRKPELQGKGRGANQGGTDREQSLRATRPKGQMERKRSESEVEDPEGLKNPKGKAGDRRNRRKVEGTRSES